MYNDQADSINVDDISSDRNNRIVLRRLQRNNVYDENNDYLWIQSEHDDDGEEGVDYVPEGADDMGWLGYFIGKNEHLRELHTMIPNIPTSRASMRDVIEPFFRGVNQNNSIQKIGFYNMIYWGERYLLCLVHSSNATKTLPASTSIIVFLEMKGGVCLHWHLGVVPTNH